MSSENGISQRWRVLSFVDDSIVPIGRYRVVLCLPHEDRIFLFALPASGKLLAGSTAVPFERNLSLIERAHQQNLVEESKFELPFSMTLPDDMLKEEKKNAREQRWKIIHSLTEGSTYEAIVADESMRAQSFNQLAIQFHVPVKRIRRLTTAYWTYGGKHGLLTNHDACGGKGQPRPSDKSGAKRGRPKLAVVTGHDPTAVGINVSPADVKLIEDITRTKIILHNWTIKRGYEHLIDNYFVKEVLGDTEPLPESECVTYQQFYYYYARLRRNLDIQRAIAKKNWNLKRRALKSTARFGVHGPCDRFEIDATVANIWLVSRFNRHRIIGRPIVYFVVDTWSRYVVGVHVALEGPKWETARLALRNAFSLKGEFLRKLGIEGNAEDLWPTPDFCQRLTADHGEVFSKEAIRLLLDNLHIQAAYAPPARGDMKAVVERKHGTLDTALSWIPGAYRKRQIEADHDFIDLRPNATLDIIQFLQVMVEEVIYWNNHEEQNDLLLPQMLEGDPDFRPTAKAMYFWGRKHLQGISNSADSVTSEESKLNHTFLPYKDCPIDRHGIRFSRRQHYTSPRLEAEGFFARRLSSEDRSGRIYYDPLFPGEALFLNTEGDRWDEVTLRPADRDAIGGSTDWDLRERFAEEALSGSGASSDKRKARHGKSKRQKMIVDIAVAQKKNAGPTPSMRSRIKDTSQNRKMEAEIERASHRTLGPKKEPTVPPDHSPAPLRSHVTSLMDRLRKKQ